MSILEINHPNNCHWMLDIETDGMNPVNNRITSIAIVKFRPGHGGLGHERYIRTVDIPSPFSGSARHYDLDTIQWRNEHPKLKENEDRLIHVSSKKMCIDIQHLFANNKENFLWAKPTNFDIPFLASYLNEFGNFSYNKMPWYYRNVRDLRSYVEGQGRDWNMAADLAAESMDRRYGKGNWAHQAIRDCEFQILHLVQEI